MIRPNSMQDHSLTPGLWIRCGGAALVALAGLLIAAGKLGLI